MWDDCLGKGQPTSLHLKKSTYPPLLSTSLHERRWTVATPPQADCTQLAFQVLILGIFLFILNFYFYMLTTLAPSCENRIFTCTCHLHKKQQFSQTLSSRWVAHPHAKISFDCLEIYYFLVVVSSFVYMSLLVLLNGKLI